MSPVGVEPAIPESEWWQTYALDSATTGIRQIPTYFIVHNFHLASLDALLRQHQLRGQESLLSLFIPLIHTFIDFYATVKVSTNPKSEELSAHHSITFPSTHKSHKCYSSNSPLKSLSEFFICPAGSIGPTRLSLFVYSPQYYRKNNRLIITLLFSNILQYRLIFFLF
jgi:hypothetical protein